MRDKQADKNPRPAKSDDGIVRYGEEGRTLVFGPVMQGQGEFVAPPEHLGQTGTPSKGGDRKLPQGGSGTAPPSNQGGTK